MADKSKAPDAPAAGVGGGEKPTAAAAGAAAAGAGASDADQQRAESARAALAKLGIGGAGAGAAAAAPGGAPGHKFWSTQPVPQHEEQVQQKVGPIDRPKTVDEIRKELLKLLDVLEFG